MKDSSIILSESRKIISAEDTLRTPIDQLTPEAQSLAWQVLDLIEKKLIKDRKAELREALLELAENLGEENKSGSKIYEIEGAKVKKIRSKGKVTYDTDKLYELMSRKGIDVFEDGVVTKKVILEVNEGKLMRLVKDKSITIGEIMSLCTVADDTFSLRVDKSKTVLDLLDE